MEREHFAEWENLQTRALSFLREEYDVPERGIECLFRILILPSFEPAYSWRLLRVNRGVEDDSDQYLARHLVWRSDTDMRKFDSPVERLKHRQRPLPPTFESRDIKVAAEVAVGMLARLHTMNVSAFPPDGRFGLDGTKYVLTVGHWFLRAEYEWWHQPPTGWEPLAEFVSRVLASLDGVTAPET